MTSQQAVVCFFTDNTWRIVMHLTWKPTALCAQRTVLEGSFLTTKGLPHMVPEDIQYYSQASGKL